MVGSDKFTRNIGIVVLVIIALLAIFWALKVRIDRQMTAEPTPINKIDNIQSYQNPSKFPTQIPIESGAKIVSNYNATSPEGKFQATRVFESSKSVTANFKLYKDFLTKGGWNIITQDSSDADLQLLIARSGNDILNISIHKATEPSKSVVDLSFVTTP